MKILSPAGNFESLKMAIYNGADEVYLGINDFNARNNIDGFNMDNLSEAVDFCHIYGVKVCLAINILFTIPVCPAELANHFSSSSLLINPISTRTPGHADLSNTQKAA